MNPPIAIEIDHQSVLLGWSAVKGALVYELQMSTTLPTTAARGEDEKQDHQDMEEWKSLSSGIKGTNIRKKNLSEDVLYHFRVRCKLPTGWDDFSPSSEDMQVLPNTTLQIAAPTLLSRDTSSVTLQWSPPLLPPLEGYRLRYRAEDSLEWTHVDTVLKNTQVKKKSLLEGVNYYFSVLPVPVPASETLPPSSTAGATEQQQEQKQTEPDEKASVFNADTDTDTTSTTATTVPSQTVFAYSPQSSPCQVEQFSAFMSNLFPKQLLAHDGTKLETAGKLAGKVVAVYFSAHWCGPCRQFTPVLSKVYQEMQARADNNKFEVVFCSADHSEPEFLSYFKSMAPWLAVDYEDDERESFMSTFKVQGIPKLVILAPDGRILVDNAVNAGFSVAMVEQWLKQCQL